MALFKKSISEKLNLDLIKFADKEKEKHEKNALYLRSEAEKEQRNLLVVGLSTGVSTTIAFGSMLAYVTNTLPLDVVQSIVPFAIIPAAGAFVATPLMNLYDKVKSGSCTLSDNKLKSVNDYEYDYQKLSIFKERIASKIETPILQGNRYMTAKDIKLEGRESLYNAFATGVVGTMLAVGLSNEITNVLPASSVETIMTVGLSSLSLYAVSPVLNLIDTCKDNYNKIASSLKSNSALANEIENGLTQNLFAAPIMQTNQLNVNMPKNKKIDYELPAKKPEIPMNQEGLMDKSDYFNLVSDVRKSYAALIPAPVVKPVSLHDKEYFMADIENEINLSIENSNIKVNSPTAHILEVPYVKDNLKKPLFIDAFVKEEKTLDTVKIDEDLSKDDLIKFVNKINDTYKPLPEPKTRQIPKEVFIFEEPELIDKPVSGITAKEASNNEININIPKELQGLKASRSDDVLPVLEMDDNGFKVKDGDDIKQFFRNHILKQKGLAIAKAENIVAPRQERPKNNMNI